jgi:hypothetical protein
VSTKAPLCLSTVVFFSSGIWNWFMSQSPELKSFRRWPSCFRAPCAVRWLGKQAIMWQSWALAVSDFLLMRCSMFSTCKLLSKYRTVIWKRRVSIGHLCLKGSMLEKNQVRSPESVLDMTVWLDSVWSLATMDHQMIISIYITEPATTSERFTSMGLQRFIFHNCCRAQHQMCLKQEMKTIFGSCTDQMCTLESRVTYSHTMKRKSPGLRAAWLFCSIQLC